MCVFYFWFFIFVGWLGWDESVGVSFVYKNSVVGVGYDRGYGD